MITGNEIIPFDFGVKMERVFLVELKIDATSEVENDVKKHLIVR